MELRELITNVLNFYPKDKKNTPFKNNPIAGLLRNGFNNISDIKKILGDEFAFKGSPGQGGWAIVPWIGIFSSDSVSAQNGIYIVYLFSADHKHVYLSLNQGWTYFKKNYGRDAKHKIKSKANELRSALTYSNENITDDPIDLASELDNPRGYKLGNILSIKYNKDKLADNDQLIYDLSDMIQLLSYLLSVVSFDDDGYYYLNYEKPVKNIKHNYKAKGPVTFEKTNVPHRSNTNKVYSKAIVSKHNYKAMNELKIINGDNGEKLVLDIEKDRLINSGRKDLADKIVHSSEKIGDGLGYDIQSFDVHGNKIYIEVKATTNGKSTPFNISPNELKASSEYKEKYKLYRLYRINDSKVEYYVISGDLNDQLDLSPTSYSGFPKN